MSHEVSQFTNEQNSIALNRHNCGSERQIVEQPPAGQFTKDIRDNWDKEEFAGASSPSGRDNFKKKLWEACHRLDRAEAINAELLTELEDYNEGCEGLKLSIQELRPFAECYRRVCESLGIDKNILGYVEKLIEQRADLLTALDSVKNILEDIHFRHSKNKKSFHNNRIAADSSTGIEIIRAAIAKVEKG